MSTGSIAVGTYFESSWGYDQTNVDFYKVTGKTAKFVTLQPVKTVVLQETGWAEAVVIPSEIEMGRPFKRKIQTYPSGIYVAINGDANASPWDGKPVRQSSYA